MLEDNANLVALRCHPKVMSLHCRRQQNNRYKCNQNSACKTFTASHLQIVAQR